ncbi:hypothetical protein A3J13_01205 [Candidatus Daviesbacteria bacterium RIFCSPLOWO2_02_FULL_36_8]|uniref:Uncharacterized protein n=1 Tax=Candidatus Daviesbacteria bacterium RIFCSPLOWO2_02_FULL_36_8 TaxID=1797793 RepID=A0A1F5MGW4_9BACT|nr:MAG: hypothetical protein A3J13_01205 [Candidatus Daviesbacteria bacterium RIFCSPLOWO2_02_FULL_36_8]
MEVRKAIYNISEYAHNVKTRVNNAPLLTILGLSLVVAACGTGRSNSEQVAFDFVTAITNSDNQKALQMSASTRPEANSTQISDLTKMLWGCKIDKATEESTSPLFDATLDAKVEVIFKEECGQVAPPFGRGYTAITIGLHKMNGEMFADPMLSSGVRPNTPRVYRPL